MSISKKIICIIIAFIFAFSFSACDSKQANYTDEAHNKVNYYNETVFESLRSFTDMSESESVSTDKTFASYTTYEYLLTEKAEEFISEYKDYLVEYGFSTDSDANSETISYKLNDYELGFSASETDNGILVKITVPCDEATINNRNEALYTEIENAFNSKEYEKITDISKKLYGDYKNSDYYVNFAAGMHYFDLGLWSYAYKNLQQFSDNPEAKTCIEEITSYNGIYKCSLEYGVIHYILINNGTVSMQISSEYSPTGYQVGNPVYYNDELINRVIPSGERQLMIGNHYSDHDVYDYGFLAMSDGTFVAAQYETSKYDTFTGIYEKISETPPAEK